MGNYNYTPEQKLNGQDLYGLPSRIPEPVGKEKECDHTTEREFFYEEEEWCEFEEDYVTRKWSEWEETCALKDVEGTHLLECSVCGYRRRY